MNGGRMSERVSLGAAAAVAALRSAGVAEHLSAPHFTFAVECVGPAEADRAAYIALRDRAEVLRRGSLLGRIRHGLELRRVRADLDAIPLFPQWGESFRNTVVDVGANDLLDKYFAGSAYTAAFYVGLISSVSYSAIAAANTMASHAGWLEAGGANAPTYSQANRPALNIATAASARSKATSAVSAFSITGTGTAKGAFITTNNTKDGTTGILYSAGLFTGGDRAVINGDTINVSGSFSA